MRTPARLCEGFLGSKSVDVGYTEFGYKVFFLTR